jgi:hypothetical protein
MIRHCNALFAATACLCLNACGAARPVLYPNAHLKTVGHATAEQDISNCMAEADNYISSGGASEQKARNVGKGTAAGAATGAATGAVGGAIAGNAGQGAAVGAATGATAGFLGTLFGVFGDSGPSPTYQRYVERCLQERGYEPIGWE